MRAKHFLLTYNSAAIPKKEFPSRVFSKAIELEKYIEPYRLTCFSNAPSVRRCSEQTDPQIRLKIRLVFASPRISTSPPPNLPHRIRLPPFPILIKMDPSYVSDDDDEEAAAMAAAMGFSTFGAKKHPAKKRKFNSATDAFVEGDELASLDRGGKKGQGSGGNTMPLGKQRVFGTAKDDSVVVDKANEDEIALEDEDEEDGPQYMDTSRPAPAEVGEDDGLQYVNTSQTAPIEAGYGDGDGPQYVDTSQPAPIEAWNGDGDGPQYIDTSQPPPSISDEEAQEMQARIDAILAAIQPSDTEPATIQDLPPPPTLSDIQAQARPVSLPQRPPPVFSDTAFMQGNQRQAWSDTASVVSSSRNGGRGRGRQGGRGQRNERWYEGYYDPSFNENPWESLEKAKGLKPLGRSPGNMGRS